MKKRTHLSAFQIQSYFKVTNLEAIWFYNEIYNKTYRYQRKVFPHLHFLALSTDWMTDQRLSWSKNSSPLIIHCCQYFFEEASKRYQFLKKGKKKEWKEKWKNERKKEEFKVKISTQLFQKTLTWSPCGKLPNQI